MPEIQPPGGAVDWPVDEGVIGVVGFAPWAALDFCRLLWSFVPARKEWEYPRVLADFNTKIPSRGRYFELNETDPSPAIRETIAELAAGGATVAAVPCNTAHLLFERWGANPSIPIAHIGHAAARWAAVGFQGKLGVLSSLTLWRHGAYGRWLGERGVPVGATEREEAQAAAAAIEHIKQARPNEAGAVMAELGQKMRRRGFDAVILGCTELALAVRAANSFPLPYLDSNQALALETLRLAGVHFTPPLSLWQPPFEKRGLSQ